MRKKLAKLEAIRGFAALYVVFHHTFSHGLQIGGKDISFLFKFGQEAVILFFILSGFVIKYAYEIAHDQSFALFFTKRFLRIYIPLLIVFFLNYAVFLLQFKQVHLNWGELGGNLLMMQDIPQLKPNVLFAPFLGNSPLWSLSYEWWFYMLFFFVNNKFKANRIPIIVYSTAIIAAATYLVYPFFLNRLLMYFAIWWVGADLAVLYLKGGNINFKKLSLTITTLVICILILAANIIIHRKGSIKGFSVEGIGISPYLELRHFFFALFALIIAVFWRKTNWFLFSRTIGLFEPIAGISFGIYITHWFLVSTAGYLSFINNKLIEFFLYLLICLTIAYVVERMIYPRVNRKIMAILYAKGLIRERR